MLIKTELKEKATSPEVMARILQDILSHENEVDRDKEHFWVIGLKTNNQIKYIELATLGILDRSIIAPREVFRLAIMQGVKSIIIAHNHPSGSLVFSPDDNKTTKVTKEAGEILDVTLLDHILISKESYKSFKEENLL